MEKNLVPLIILSLVLAALIGAGLGYFIGYDHGIEAPTDEAITSFEDCAAAGYPVMESYPEQCRTPDGVTYVREIPEEEKETPQGLEEPNKTAPKPVRPSLPEPTACTMDAFICPDGTAVGRTGPNCTFPACPGE